MTISSTPSLLTSTPPPTHCPNPPLPDAIKPLVPAVNVARSTAAKLFELEFEWPKKTYILLPTAEPTSTSSYPSWLKSPALLTE
jgi:hypothetical protein